MVEHLSELPRKFVYFTLCICRSDKWLGDSVFFHQMTDNLFQVMKTSLPCCLCLMTIAMAIEGGITLEHTCTGSFVVNGGSVADVFMILIETRYVTLPSSCSQ